MGLGLAGGKILLQVPRKPHRNSLHSQEVLPYMYRIWYIPLVGKKPKSLTGIHSRPEALERQGKQVPAIFFRTEAGGEPVRDWLKGLPSPEDRKRIGEDIKTVEFGWPIGMPVCRPLGDGISLLSKLCITLPIWTS